MEGEDVFFFSYLSLIYTFYKLFRIGNFLQIGVKLQILETNCNEISILLYLHDVILKITIKVGLKKLFQM